MLKRSTIWLVFALAVALSLAARTQAQAPIVPAAPTAIRVRVAHLAPFPGSSANDITIALNGVTLGASMSYGDKTDYQTVAGAPGTFTVEVTRQGAPVDLLTDAVTLVDGDQSLVLIGDITQIPLDVLLADDTRDPPPAGRGDLRVAHAAAIGNSNDTTKVEVCSQDGLPFQPGADALRYNRTTTFKQLDAGEYDLKVMRFVEDPACSGQLAIDLPLVTLPSAAVTTLYLVGDGTNHPLTGFTFADGLLGEQPPEQSQVMIPALIR